MPRGIGQNAAFAALYAVTAWLCLRFATLNESASPIWVPSGLAIAALIVAGRRLWPGVFAGAMAANLINSGHVWSSTVIAVGNTLEGVAAAWLVERLGGRRMLDSPVGVGQFTVVAGLAAAISATIGVGALSAFGMLRSDLVVSVWLTWWMGDAAGALVIAPLLLVWHETWRARVAHPGELAALAVAAALVFLVVFTPVAGSLPQLPLSFTLIPAVAWAAFRFGRREALTLAAITSAVAVAGTVNGYGPFLADDLNTSLIVLASFIAVITVTALVLSAIVRQLRDKGEELRRANEGLEQRVQARTRDLSESEARFAQFMQNVPGLAWIKDGQGRYVFANDAFAKAAGQTASTLLGKTDADIFPAAIAREYQANDAAVRTQGAPLQTVESQQVQSELRHSLVAKFPIGDAGTVGGIAIDVTERERLEQDRERNLRQVAEAERVTKRGTWEWDVTWDRAQWSDGMYRIFGVDRATFQNTNENFLAMVLEEDRPRMLAAMQAALAKPGRFLQEYRLRRPDGELRHFRGEGDVVPGAAGTSTKLFGTVQDVTEIRQLEQAQRDAEEALKASEERFRLLSESAFEGVVVNVDGRIVECNTAFAAMLGVNRDQAIGREVLSFVATESQAMVARRIAAQDSRPYEAVGLRADASRFPVEVVGRPTMYHGKPARVSTLRDLTQRRQAEQALRQSEELFRSLSEHNPTGVFRADAKGGFTYTNGRWQEIAGVDGAHALGMGWLDAVHPEDQARVAADWRAAITTGTAFRHEFRFQHGDASHRWIAGQAAPVRGEDGVTVAFVGTHEDVTEARKARQEVERSKHLLDTAEQVAGQGSWSWDLATDQITWSPGLFRIYGLEPSWTIAHDKFLAMVHPDDRPGLAKAMMDVARSPGRILSEYRLTRPDGQTRWFRVDGNYLPAAKTLAGIVQDVTSERELRAARDRAVLQEAEIARLREVSDFKTRFINNAAHELSTPLTPIRLQMAILREKVDGEASRALDVVDRNFVRLQNVVRDILDAARIQGEHLRLQPAPVDLAKLLHQAAETFEAQARTKSQKILLALHHDSLVLADRERTEQVMLNLLSNAVKFTPARGTVRIETQQTPSHVAVLVSDTGIGFDDEQRKRLFHADAQARDETATGSGLGLYIAKAIIERQGGTLEAASPGPGKGATFTFTIPRANRPGARPDGYRDDALRLPTRA